jgi:hypothetical protein
MKNKAYYNQTPIMGRYNYDYNNSNSNSSSSSSSSNNNNNNNNNNRVFYTFANMRTFTLLSWFIFVSYERYLKERLIHNPHTMCVVKTVVYRCVSLRENSSLQAGSTGTIGKSL